MAGGTGCAYFLKIGITKNIELMCRQIIEDGIGKRFVDPKLWIERDRIGGEYAKAVDSLAKENQSLDWWAYNFVSKSPIATKLFERIAWSVVILNFVVKGGLKDGEMLVVLTDDREIFSQVKAALKDSCRVIRHVITKFDLREFIKTVSSVAPVAFFLKKIFSKIVSRFMFRDLTWSSRRYEYVFLSLLNQQSFLAHSYRDFYFSPLIDHLSRSNSRCLNLLLVWPPFIKNLKNLKQYYPATHDALPIEHLFGFTDLIKVFGKALKKIFIREKIHGDFCVHGHSFLKLVKRHKRGEEFSASLSLSFLLFYIGEHVARRYAGAKVIYPFENRAFERMFIKGIKQVSGDMKLFGHQHAALTKTHLNYFLGENEKKYMPLPDRILASGETPRNILHEFFGHSDEKLVAASSLRRNPAVLNDRSRRGKIESILVIISTDLDEYKRVLLFLEQLSKEKDFFSYHVTIRPHPVIPLSSALNDLPELSFRINEQSAAIPLNEALSSADLVLFASSTVSLEALSAGVPAVYLDVSPFLDNNPLGFWPAGCERVSSPDELIKVLDRLNKESAKYDVGKDYAGSYLSEINESLFERILEKA